MSSPVRSTRLLSLKCSGVPLKPSPGALLRMPGPSPNIRSEECAALRREADVLAREVDTLALVEVLRRAVEALAWRALADARPFAEYLPRPRGIDRLGVHFHPRCDGGEDLELPVVGHAARRQRDVEQQIAVAADNIHQQIDDRLRPLVDRLAVVMPVPDAGVGLERPRLDFIHHAALDIQNACAGRAFAAPFAGINHIHLPMMPAQALVVVVRHQAAAPAAERNAAVFIVQVGLVLIDQILRPQEPLALPLLRLVPLLAPGFPRRRVKPGPSRA